MELLPSYVVIWTHTSISAFLLRSMWENAISGLSHQTLLAMTVYAILCVIQKVYWNIYYHMKGLEYEVFPEWHYEFAGLALNAIILLACLVVAKRNPKLLRSQHNGDPDEVADSFGMRQVRYLWYMIPGQSKPPPANLHYLVVYASSFIVAFLTALASCHFSPSVLSEWANRRPTAMMAVYENFLRGFGMLPQLQVSRHVGVVSSALALWIAAFGIVDLFEMLCDGFEWSQMCYTFGDLISMIVVSDFCWVCIKSRMRGKQDVEIPVEFRDTV